MKRYLVFVLILSLLCIVMPFLASVYAEEVVISSHGAREWLDSTDLSHISDDTMVIVCDVPDGTFCLTANEYCDLIFTIELMSSSDSFTIEVWRENQDGQIQKSQSEQVDSENLMFTIPDVQPGETIYWRDIDANGNTCNKGFYLGVSEETQSDTPESEPLSESASDLYPDYYIGAIVEFGVYPQERQQYGKYYDMDIEWIVLDIQGENALLLSKDGLDCKCYHEEEIDMTWEECDLRQWLNDEFYNMAFRKYEKPFIITADVSADENPDWETDPGNDTLDNVFLLSVNEVFKYFPDQDDRLCAPTQYARSHNAFANEDGNGWWWLRTPGRTQSDGTMVNSTGRLGPSGDPVTGSRGCVRPCIWVKMH
jgi:hypothetical protein